MNNRFFITGTGTGIGKTVVSAIVTEALRADYWKPVQAGFDEGTDSEWISSMLSDPGAAAHSEYYKLKLPASPHIAARRENITIDIARIAASAPRVQTLVIEGAGGLMVPLNDNQFIPDLIKALKAKVILVSKNELGSINHSLLTAMVCKQYQLDVAGWIFNGRYLDYEEEICRWTNIPRIGSIPYAEKIDRAYIREQAASIGKQLKMLHE